MLLSACPLVPEDNGVFAGGRLACVQDDVRGEDTAPRLRLHGQADAARRVARGVDDLDPRLDLVALVHLRQAGVGLNHCASPTRRGPVVAMRALRVASLPGVDEERGVLEEVKVLVVVPVGVAHHRDVDVGGGKPAPLQGPPAWPCAVPRGRRRPESASLQ